MQRLKATMTRRRLGIGGIVLVALIGVFFGGYFVGDDSGEVSSLNDQVAQLEDELGGAESQATLYGDEVEGLEEVKASLQGQLHAERSLNGNTSVEQNTSDYNTDFAWETAGTVGYLAMKPIDFTQVGEKWFLTIEAKNEGTEPKQPFCGDGGSVLVDGAGRTYSGEAVLGSGSDDCSDELQPGLTGTFKAEFSLPPDAKPVATAIYGDYEQEEEAKTWALPE
jgi:hypothetical protein